MSTKSEKDERKPGRSAKQVSLPSDYWKLAELVVEKREDKFKDMSALFQLAFEDLMEKLGFSLRIELVEENVSKRAK